MAGRSNEDPNFWNLENIDFIKLAAKFNINLLQRSDLKNALEEVAKYTPHMSTLEARVLVLSELQPGSEIPPEYGEVHKTALAKRPQDDN